MQANHLFFQKYEPFGRTVLYVLAILLVEPVVLCLLLAYASPAATVQWTNYIFAYGAFFASLLSSIILYRLSPFHPLAKVPGPMMHKVSKLWSVWICWQGRQHTEFKAMHDKYGPVVRTGMWGTCILLNIQTPFHHELRDKSQLHLKYQTYDTFTAISAWGINRALIPALLSFLSLSSLLF